MGEDTKNTDGLLKNNYTGVRTQVGKTFKDKGGFAGMVKKKALSKKPKQSASDEEKTESKKFERTEDETSEK